MHFKGYIVFLPVAKQLRIESLGVVMMFWLSRMQAGLYFKSSKTKEQRPLNLNKYKKRWESNSLSPTKFDKMLKVISSVHYLTNRTDNTIFNTLKESFCIRPTASKSIAIEHIHYLKEIQKCTKIKWGPPVSTPSPLSNNVSWFAFITGWEPG